MADYYGEVIPDGTEQDTGPDPLRPKTTLAKNYGHFPTPDGLANAMVVRESCLYRQNGAPPLTVLEPSAGGGKLARRARGSSRVTWHR